MSMLAEPRRKQKWSVDPRNSTWSNDESKFGQKMLERMGWSKGKGLGKSEQGAKEHIKVKTKNNALGLGFAISNEDNWIAHQDDFNQLLADLNNCHGQSKTEESTQEQSQGFSLEVKSKTSKKRVHYMKFTKGKDLSNRSKTDLACIFGKRSKQAEDQDESSSSSDSQEEKEQEGSYKDEQICNPEPELNTVTSTLTMQEYFSQRMAQLRKGRVENQATTSSIGSNSSPQSASVVSESSENTSNIMEENKKKKKKKRKDRQIGEEVKELEDSPMMEETSAVEQTVSVKKTKKKKKKRDREEEYTEGEYSILTAESDVVENSLSGKKKKKSKDRLPHMPTGSVSEHDVAEEVYSDSSKKRKRRTENEEQPEVMVEKNSRNKKKK